MQFSPLLRKEIQFWRFLDNWDKCIPWRQERHVAISVSCDASLFRCAAVFHLNSSEFTIGDYWDEDLKDKHINVKEMFAVSKALESLPRDVWDCTFRLIARLLSRHGLGVVRVRTS